jgi:hypothetical protein
MDITSNTLNEKSLTLRSNNFPLTPKECISYDVSAPALTASRRFPNVAIYSSKSLRLPTGREASWNNVKDDCRSKGDPSSPLYKVAKTLSWSHMNIDFNTFDNGTTIETEITSKKTVCPLLPPSISSPKVTTKQAKIECGSISKKSSPPRVQPQKILKQVSMSNLEHSTKVATGTSEQSQGQRLSLRCTLSKTATSLRQLMYRAESLRGIGKPPKMIPNLNKHPSHNFATPQEMDGPVSSHTTTVESSANLDHDDGVAAPTVPTHQDPSLQSSTRKLAGLYDLPSLVDEKMPIIECKPLLSKTTPPTLPGTPMSRWRNRSKSRSTELDPVLGMVIIVSHTEHINI